MDEIDWIKNIKKVLILLAKVYGGCAIFFTIIVLLASPNNDWEYTRTLLFIALIIGVGLPAIPVICYFIISIFLKILNSGRIVINFDKDYIRDLPKQCSPAISSLIYDLKIDVYKDYTATILYLCTKKYIELVKDEETYKIKIAKQQNYTDLGRGEKYVLDIIQDKNKFDENHFKKEIIKEAQEKELITNKMHSKKTKIALILILIVSSLIITYNISKLVFVFLICILGAIALAGYMIIIEKNENQIILDVVDTEYIRTKEGKNMALLLKGLKRYIREYTLIKDKEIDYIQILENYIPYALVLDEADTIEEFIKNNEEYRELIYNRKSV